MSVKFKIKATKRQNNLLRLNWMCERDNYKKKTLFNIKS